MSTATATPAAGAAAPNPATNRGDRTSLARLTLIELRKMVDTRAGLWLLAVIVLLTFVSATILLAVGEDADRTFAEAFTVAQFPSALLLPVVAILAATSEWAQRTALTTFALVPDRARIVAAKLLAMAALAAAAVALALVAATVAMVVGPLLGGDDAEWRFAVREIGEGFVFQLAGVWMGAAFGFLLLRTAPAIVLYFALPTIWSIALSTIPGLDDAAEWLATDTTFSPLMEAGGTSGDDWARVAVSALVWVVLPLAAGVWRIRRSEVR